MTEPSNNERHWFVMRDLRRANARITAYQLLMKDGYEAFTPMTLRKNQRTGAKELVPVMQWLLFIHATKHEIDELITPSNPRIPHMQYIYARGKSSRLGGMTVDDRSMNYFRTAVAKQEIPVVYNYSDITPDMRGRRVLVTRGDMIGYQGHLQKYTDGKNMRLFVELDGFCLAPIQISPEDVTFLDEVQQTMVPNEEHTYYTRLSRLVDIINFLRFSLPQDLDTLDDQQLAEVRMAYIMANRIFDEYRTREYLCVDEVCHSRLAEIERLMQKRTARQAPATTPPRSATTTDTEMIARMRHLCQLVRAV